MNFKTLHDFDLKGKKVLLRADLNVPIDDDYNVTDTTRIDRLKPTIDALRGKGARIIVMSHFGRPKGERRKAYSLQFIPPFLKKSWGVDVAFVDDCIGPAAAGLTHSLKEGQIGLLENLRFYKGEEENDESFVKELAKLGDIYINDAFSAAHRAHASTEGLAHALPAGAGLLMSDELKALNEALDKPHRPLIAIVGGAKISTKLELLGNLLPRVNMLALGGGMANTFLAAQGVDVKSSLCETDMIGKAREISEEAKKSGCKLILPVDAAVDSVMQEKGVPPDTCDIANIPAGQMILDIGPKTVSVLKEAVSQCKTVVWNGPMGAFEIKPFDRGTVKLAQFVAELTEQKKIKSVAGGGDTVAALEQAGVADKFSYVSTAGGAFLEWLEGKTLPGVAALMDEKKAA